MKIAIGSDGTGFEYKKRIIENLEKKGHTLEDFGTYSADEVDYPLFVRPVTAAVSGGTSDRGIFLGDTGIGAVIASNRQKGVRCVLCPDSSTALVSRTRYDTNMISIASPIADIEKAFEIISVWLDAPFEGGRYKKRVDMIDSEAAFIKAKEASDKKGNLAKGAREEYDLLIAFRYLKYIEGNNSFELSVDPGLKTPSIVYIPSKEKWNSEIPAWAHNRREEILDRIKAKCNHMEMEWRDY